MAADLDLAAQLAQLQEACDELRAENRLLSTALEDGDAARVIVHLQSQLTAARSQCAQWQAKASALSATVKSLQKRLPKESR